MACAWIDYASENIVHVETFKYTDTKIHWSAVAKEWFFFHTFLFDPDAEAYVCHPVAGAGLLSV